MSEAMHPMGASDEAGDTGDAGSQGQAGPAGPAGPAGRAPSTAREAHRPALVTFAAVLLFLEGGFSVAWAIVDFTQPQWLLNVYSAYGFTTPGSTAWAWGFVDLLVGAVAVFAGFGVLRGGAFAQIVGLCVISFSALRWFFFLPFVPLVAILFISLDVLVVYALATNSDYFATFDTGPLFGTTREEPFT